MAYSHGYAEQFLAGGSANLTTTGVKGEWGPGYQPGNVRAVALIMTTAISAHLGELTVWKRPVKGSASNQVKVADIEVPPSTPAGKVVYVDGLDVRVQPGESIAFDVTSATPSAGVADLVVVYQPNWEGPANNANMINGAA